MFVYLLLVIGIPPAIFIGCMFWWYRERNRRTRVPIAMLPRPAGYSLQSRVTDRMFDFMMHMMLMCFVGVFAVLMPGLRGDWITLFFILGVGVPLFSVLAWRALRKAVYGQFGLRGEQCVGVVLDQLAGPDCRVFHDLEVKGSGGRTWNIDHVVVTRSRVFAVETKMRRKPRGRGEEGAENWRVTFDGSALAFPFGRDEDSVKQAVRNAEWLAAQLSSWNGAPVEAAPMLVIPGWWIDRKARGSVWVMNEKELAKGLPVAATRFSDERFRALCGQIGGKCQVELK